jgi:hypothetical protein
VSRDLMSRMRAKALPNGVRAPSWAFLYRLKTIHKQNKKGQWFQFVIEDHGWVDNVDDYNRGKAMNNSIEAGEIKAKVEDDDANADGDGSM